MQCHIAQGSISQTVVHGPPVSAAVSEEKALQKLQQTLNE
jgi:hypothetical protein